MARRRKTRIIHIHGRRWFEKTNGNTYHTCMIWVDGEFAHKIEFRYGYGTQYSWEAKEWLRENGYLPGIEEREGTPGESLWRYCERSGIKLIDEVDDVQRRKDL